MSGERDKQSFIRRTNDWKPYEVKDSNGRKKKHYAIFITTNRNYPRSSTDKYTIWCKKTFGNISGQLLKTNSKEGILQIIKEHLEYMCKPDDLVKNPPKPIRKNIIITIGDLDLTLTETEIEKTLFGFGNEITIPVEQKIIFEDKETELYPIFICSECGEKARLDITKNNTCVFCLQKKKLEAIKS